MKVLITIELLHRLFALSVFRFLAAEAPRRDGREAAEGHTLNVTASKEDGDFGVFLECLHRYWNE
jgi:hypothetical protein